MAVIRHHVHFDQSGPRVHADLADDGLQPLGDRQHQQLAHEDATLKSLMTLM